MLLLTCPLFVPISFFSVSLSVFVFLHAAAALTFFESVIQIYINPISSPLLSSLLFCLSPGFSAVPEDLLPDFDLKIMPGRGIMYSPPHLVPSIHTNPTYCSNMGVGTIWMVVVVGVP